MNLSFAVVSPADITLLSLLHQSCFSDNWDEEAMTEILAMPGVTGWIGYVEPVTGDGTQSKIPAGLTLCRHAADEAEILTIGVLPVWRGVRIGWAFLAKVKEELRRQGIRKLFLEVSEYNAPALALYEKFGFTEVGRRARYYDSRTDALVLRCEIL